MKRKKKNMFSPLPNPWSQEDWHSFIGEDEYRVISPQELPPWYPQDLASKLQCAIMYCSSSTATLYYGINGLRMDKNEIDEDPYVWVCGKETGECHSGFIHHGDWPGRTTPIPNQMQQAITASGFDLDYRFTRLPTEPSGSIEDLEKQGLLEGFHISSRIVEREGFRRKSKWI